MQAWSKRESAQGRLTPFLTTLPTMSRFTHFQRAYLIGSTALGLAALAASLAAALRAPPPPGSWLLALGLAVIYGVLWTQNEEFETPTAHSPVLIEVSNTPLLIALGLTGPIAVPLLLAADLCARWWQRGGRQPLGYLFNFNLIATNALTVLAAIRLVTNGDLQSLSVFPAGSACLLIILAVTELFSILNQALLVAVGSRRTVRDILLNDVRPLALVTIIPSAMGLLIVAVAVSAPGLVIPMLIPVVLSRYAIQAIARWARQHILLEQQVVEQTAAIRAQAAQIEAQEQTRHQHTVLLVHDLEKEFRLGQRLMQRAIVQAEAPTERSVPEYQQPLALVEIAAIFERGLAMSADILLGSTLRAGQATYQPAPANLTTLVATVTGRYMPIAQAAGVQLTLDCDEVVCLSLDAPKLDRALANLLNNAIDYTKGCAERKVTVALTGEGHAVVVRVADTGIGIEPEAIGHIGQRFTRLAAGQEFHHGNGLGLFGVAAIVGMHGGRISVTSPGRNQGTVVSLELPLQTSPAPAQLGGI